ncbi:MAG TPA: hypothetical protein VLS28_00425, partial [Candidatus Sulfomarinibacteraceae bacterium]|nr:hypothetical protein [Candidatus Sulfomarinibacteraceae bacterium]
MTRGVVRLAAAAVLGLGIAGCGPAGSPSPPPPSPAQLNTAAPTTPGATSTPTSTADIAAAVAIDPALLVILPATVDGFPVVESPEGEATALADPILPSVGRAVAAGF